MNIKMLKTAIVFFILALSTGTPSLASTARYSPLHYQFSISFCHSVLDTESMIIKDKTSSLSLLLFPSLIAGVVHKPHFSIIPEKAGIQSFVVPVNGGIHNIETAHRPRRLPDQDGAFITADSASRTLNYVNAVSIQASQPCSYNLSDIFIPPKTII